MIEELKIISEMFQGLTDGALYAAIGFMVYKLFYLALIVFPCVSAFKFLIQRMFVNERVEDK